MKYFNCYVAHTKFTTSGLEAIGLLIEVKPLVIEATFLKKSLYLSGLTY